MLSRWSLLSICMGRNEQTHRQIKGTANHDHDPDDVQVLNHEMASGGGGKRSYKAREKGTSRVKGEVSPFNSRCPASHWLVDSAFGAPASKSSGWK